MKNLSVCRENGELKINFTLDTNLSMLEQEEQIESLIESGNEEFSKLEKLQIKKEILQALKGIILKAKN